MAAISPTREENYPEWYQQVILNSDLAADPETVPGYGCMVIKPWGFSIWENMQRVLDGMFKDTGHVNAYFPLFIPLSLLQKEADHVEGFAKECAVVTHHRLETGPDGKLRPAPGAELGEPLIVRPTSETIIGAMYAQWVQSYRDLPILINQWANVVRWEMRTRLFLRTAEFLWQEGHTAHATSEEAMEETLKILDVYADFAENYMAMPVVKGEKTEGERFPGAVHTYSIEAMMQDRKALQAGTSHFLGQNFSKAQDIKFQDAEGQLQHAWTTSWGVSTRLVGGLIMTHSDDDGLVLPPRLAPKQVVICPIYRKDEERASVMEYCTSLQKELADQSFDGGPFGPTKIQVELDDRDISGGDKKWQHIKRGVPVRLEIGPRDIKAGGVFGARRDTGDKLPKGTTREQFVAGIGDLLSDIQNNLFERAKTMQDDNTAHIDNVDEFKDYFTPADKKRPELHGGFAWSHYVEDPAVDAILKDLKVTIRCIPQTDDKDDGICIFTGRKSKQRAVFAKAY